MNAKRETLKGGLFLDLRKSLSETLFSATSQRLCAETIQHHKLGIPMSDDQAILNNNTRKENLW